MDKKYTTWPRKVDFKIWPQVKVSSGHEEAYVDHVAYITSSVHYLSVQSKATGKTLPKFVPKTAIKSCKQKIT